MMIRNGFKDERYKRDILEAIGFPRFCLRKLDNRRHRLACFPQIASTSRNATRHVSTGDKFAIKAFKRRTPKREIVMAITVILEAKAKPGTGNDFIKTMQAILPDTRSYDGCIEINTYQNQDDADVMVLVGKWESREKYDKYLGWRHERGDLDTLGEALAGEPSIRYFDLTDA
jgi:quinol monooxygenase YgiN